MVVYNHWTTGGLEWWTGTVEQCIEMWSNELKGGQYSVVIWCHLTLAKGRLGPIWSSLGPLQLWASGAIWR